MLCYFPNDKQIAPKHGALNAHIKVRLWNAMRSKWSDGHSEIPLDWSTNDFFADVWTIFRSPPILFFFQFGLMVLA